jgi:hypothetical protein
MSISLTYAESSQIYPNGVRRDFVFLSPAGYVPVLGGTVVWEEKDNSLTTPAWVVIASGDYTASYQGGGTQDTVSPQVTLTLDDSVAAPSAAIIFRATVESQTVGSSSYVAPVNITAGDYVPSDYRSIYPQIQLYPAITDNVLVAKINEASIYCNYNKFGVYYKTAMGLLVSHVLSMEIDSGFYTKQGSGIGLTLGLATSGALSSASAGSVSYSLAVEGGGGSAIREWLKGTGWGQRFLTIRDMVTAPKVSVSRYC